MTGTTCTPAKWVRIAVCPLVNRVRWVMTWLCKGTQSVQGADMSVDVGGTNTDAAILSLRYCTLLYMYICTCTLTTGT